MKNQTQPEPKPTEHPVGQIDIQIADLESQIKSHRKRRTLFYAFNATGVFIMFIFIFLGPSLLKSAHYDDAVAGKVPLWGSLGIACLVLGSAYAALFRSIHIGSLQRDLDTLRAKRNIMARSPMDKDDTHTLSYFDRLVEINITNLEAYYKLVKEHTNNSFLASILAGTVGFLLIAAGLIVGFSGVDNTHYIGYVASASGILTEFIAGVFFYLYNRTVSQLKTYHDSLIGVQNILLSFKIVDGTDDPNKQASLMELILKCLIKAPDKINVAGA